jgi:hypothetical protein
LEQNSVIVLLLLLLLLLLSPLTSSAEGNCLVAPQRLSNIHHSHPNAGKSRYSD